MAVLLGVVDAVAEHEAVADGKAGEIDGDLDRAPARLVDQRASPYPRGALAQEQVPGEGERTSALDSLPSGR